jgi:hypothetical protein
LLDPEENVRPSPGRHHFPTTIRDKTRSARLPPEHYYAQPVATRHAPHLLQLGRQQLWSKYMNKDDAEHLLNAIQKYYKCSSDWDAKQYCGLTFKWDYEGKKVHSSMPNYLAKALQHFQHPPPPRESTRPAISPHKTKLWSQGAVCKARGYFPPPQQSGYKISSGGLQRIPFPCTRR